MTYFDTDVVIHSIIVQDQIKHNQAIDRTTPTGKNEPMKVGAAALVPKLQFGDGFA